MMINLTSLSDVRSLLADWDYHPSRAMGQNFLIDRNIRDILIREAGLSSKDCVLEIGPGLGVLTEPLLAETEKVVAVELDSRLFAFLSDHFIDQRKLELLKGDALVIGIEDLLSKGINKVVSNLPYSVGSRILVDLARALHPPELIVATVQLEVAQRLVSGPGGKHYGLISAWCQYRYDMKLVKTISPTCFWPCPEVRSGIVLMKRIPARHNDAKLSDLFYKLTKYAFSYRRKQIGTILSRAPQPFCISVNDCHRFLESIGAVATARPEDLNIDQWCRLAESLSSCD